MAVWKNVAFSIFILIPTVQCSAGEPGAKAEETAVTVDDIAADAGRYSGQNVTLEGIFQGFIVAGCRFPDRVRPAGLTRRDWLLRTGETCIYVSRGHPDGADPFNPEHRGRHISVSGTVTADGEGRVYLNFEHGRVIDGER